MGGGILSPPPAMHAAFTAPPCMHKMKLPKKKKNRTAPKLGVALRNVLMGGALRIRRHPAKTALMNSDRDAGPG